MLEINARNSQRIIEQLIAKNIIVGNGNTNNVNYYLKSE
jgi:hypothetical protein